MNNAGIASVAMFDEIDDVTVFKTVMVINQFLNFAFKVVIAHNIVI